MQPLIMLVYTSQSRNPIDDELVNSILQASKKNNPEKDITGFLTARGDYLLQLLEGPEDAVKALYQHISKDTRHHRITLQGSAVIEKRLTANWNMGYIRELKETQPSTRELLDLFDLARDGQAVSTPKALETMIRMFCKDVQVIA